MQYELHSGTTLIPDVIPVSYKESLTLRFVYPKLERPSLVACAKILNTETKGKYFKSRINWCVYRLVNDNLRASSPE